MVEHLRAPMYPGLQKNNQKRWQWQTTCKAWYTLHLLHLPLFFFSLERENTGIMTLHCKTLHLILQPNKAEATGHLEYLFSPFRSSRACQGTFNQQHPWYLSLSNNDLSSQNILNDQNTRRQCNNCRLLFISDSGHACVKGHVKAENSWLSYKLILLILTSSIPVCNSLVVYLVQMMCSSAREQIVSFQCKDQGYAISIHEERRLHSRNTFRKTHRECDYFQMNMFLLHREVDPARSVLHCRKGHN